MRTPPKPFVPTCTTRFKEGVCRPATILSIDLYNSAYRVAQLCRLRQITTCTGRYTRLGGCSPQRSFVAKAVDGVGQRRLPSLRCALRCPIGPCLRRNASCRSSHDASSISSHRSRSNAANCRWRCHSSNAPRRQASAVIRRRRKVSMDVQDLLPWVYPHGGMWVAPTNVISAYPCKGRVAILRRRSYRSFPLTHCRGQRRTPAYP